MRPMFQSPALLVCAAGFLLLSTGCGETGPEASTSDAVVDAPDTSTGAGDASDVGSTEEVSTDVTAPDTGGALDTGEDDAAVTDATSTDAEGPTEDVET